MHWRPIPSPLIDREETMSEDTKTTPAVTPPKISVDVWAVVLALVLVALVRLGWLPGVSW
jgi:hypothetical protein